MTKDRSISVKRRLQRLGEFSLIFGRRGFKFGKMVTEDPDTGDSLMPYYVFNDDAEAFIKTCYEYGWVLAHFDWPIWKDTSEAMKLNNPDAIARVTPDQIAKLLTVLVRQERFCAGSLAASFKRGLLGAILCRAMALARDE
jgi:Family of unknown function (DUF6508)